MKGYLDQQVPFTFPQVSRGPAGRDGGCSGLGPAPVRDSALTCSFRSSLQVGRLPVGEL